MSGMTDADPSTSRSEDDGAEGGRGVAPTTTWERAADAFTRWQSGDPRAMDELVRAMSPVLWHVVRAYGLEAMLAEDVVQATWLTLVRRHESVQDARAIAGWLTTTARREAWRAGRAGQRVRTTDTVDLEPLLPSEESAESRAELSDRDSRLWRAADDLGMPVGSIGPTRGRCLGKLRTALAADGWKGDDRDF